MATTQRQRGLYDARYEHDACGVALLAELRRGRTHDLVDHALGALENLAHRGAFGADPETGDGAGISLQMPHELFSEVAPVDLPGLGAYASGMVYLPAEKEAAATLRRGIEALAAEEGLVVSAWRDVPVDLDQAGVAARKVAPAFAQVFVVPDPEGPWRGAAGIDLERRVFVLRKRIENTLEGAYLPSLSTRTFVYKGMLATDQLRRFYPELADERVRSALALVHSRFSTNTFPSWPLAHPYRLIAHNGEINTVGGNRNWMRAREALLECAAIPGLERALPVLENGASDSASFDEVLELLHLAGRSLPHAMLMMIPEAWENNDELDDAVRAFYQYHSCLMEPWDGPAVVAFTDGTRIGAVLDRNGLRPGRYWVTDEGLVVLASEVGVIDVDPTRVVRKGRLQPGKMFLVDTAGGRIVEDEEIKATLAAEHPYRAWLDEHLLRLEDLPPRTMLTPQHGSLVPEQRLFGFTGEELRMILAPMASAGAEPVGSMGSDTPVAVLSERPRLCFDYFSQLFAQVTNPPLDAIREELVTSLAGRVGAERNLLEPEPGSCHQIILDSPILANDDLAKLLYVNEHGETPGFRSFVVDGLFPVAGGGVALETALGEVCEKVLAAIEEGANLIVLSDRHSSRDLAPIPSLLLTAAVHHHLVREKARARTALLVETGEAREVHHMALLVGYGASAVNPYLAIDSVVDMFRRGELDVKSERKAVQNYVKAASKGVLKVMSKMGISTIASYTGAQVFEAIGLDQALVDRYFTGTSSRLGGAGLDILAEETARRHHRAYLDRPGELAHREVEVGGDYQWRREGEHHLFNPRTVFKLQHATRAKRFDVFREYSRLVDDQSERLATLRGLLRLRTGDDAVRPPVPLEEVEPASAIIARFSTGAMSYGSISAEAHQTLAIAMNRLGGKSNTGEGGEDPDRFTPEPNGDSRRSAIKQVASGRFGVTSNYLVNADDIQIKMAQGAKPGEGGQLPGHKVYPWIAATRYSTPGVGLISPPPHHDIYSIEDLAQLIHDLKNANPRARIHVKLVAEVGVGTVAAGVSKAHADVVLISGADGGTGAAPLTSLKHAGAPWELGLAETQQTLVRNGLRDRIVVQTDGQLKTGRDVVVAALLGAEEFGFATAPLVVSGCIMMRVCHLDTCPVGIATQNPELRARYTGRPEFVETFFEYVAEEVREHLAALGFRSIDEAVGQVGSLDATRAVEHWKAAGLDLAPLLEPSCSEHGPCGLHRTTDQDHGLEAALDNWLIQQSTAALEDRKPVCFEGVVRNINRTVGTMLGSEVTRRFGGDGLPEGTITVVLRGSAGQSFGAFLPSGIELRLHGDANDYLAKGLSGGRVVVRPPEGSPFEASENVIAGNVCAYGATSGELFVSGRVGERFCVRNSGATAVVEGVGDHGCEYMTGGRVLVLGATGRNFAAGMSGGIAYVHDPDRRLEHRCNRELVDLEPLDEEDGAFVAGLLARHAELTGSVVARRLHERLPRALEEMVKVMPRDYRRVLEVTRKAREEGTSVDDAIMAAAHG